MQICEPVPIYKTRCARLQPYLIFWSRFQGYRMDNSLTPDRLRKQIRSGAFESNTSGLAPGYVQCNLVVLPELHAADFLRFCQLNPKPCPLIAVSEPGEASFSGLGDIDLRTIDGGIIPREADHAIGSLGVEIEQ